ncbi:hypothetical protein [Pseudorhodobacter turbinis]|uniref:hypothetical protein n=1 Tax=Pseudorhodobacter turbinis TaxID=2500533 RepID=UPI00143CCE90|nr:hypothetical protein [Pseudorhodobacter turbinis]
MPQTILENFAEQARIAAAPDNRTSAIRELLKNSMSEADAMADAITAQQDDEVTLF